LGNKGRWEYLRAIYERYRKAGRKGKKVILSEFCANTGYHRKYAIRLLNGPRPEKRRTRRAGRRGVSYNSQRGQYLCARTVETTPRTRPQHTWTTNMLTALVDSTTPVLISGWLMYDSEHIGAIGTQRAAVWEVHPITKIEVQTNGQWVNAENRP
jgi:hypothetical protein